MTRGRPATPSTHRAPARGPGAPGRGWRQLPAAGSRRWRSAVVIAAHPDDEVLGRGGTMRPAGRRGRPAAAGRRHRRGGVSPGPPSPQALAQRRLAETAGRAARPRCPRGRGDPAAAARHRAGRLRGRAHRARCGPSLPGSTSASPPGSGTCTPTTRRWAGRPAGPPGARCSIRSGCGTGPSPAIPACPGTGRCGSRCRRGWRAGSARRSRCFTSQLERPARRRSGRCSLPASSPTSPGTMEVLSPVTP